MSDVERELAVAGTAAITSTEIQCTVGRDRLHITCPGMVDGEGSAKIQYESGGIWSDYYIDDELQTISADVGSRHSGRVITAPGNYRVVKPITAAAVPVIAQTLA